jgi:hypothetical protein
VLTLYVVGMIRADDVKKQWIAGLFLGLVVILFVLGWFQERREERRLRRWLEGREPLGAEAFAAQFGDVPRGPETAAAVRSVLEQHMQRDLGGLRPDDPLTEFRDWLDPIFIDDVAEKLGVAAPADYPQFEALMSSPRTLRELIEALARWSAR